MTIANNIKSTIPKIESDKEYMKFVEEHSQSDSTDKSLAETLMGTLTTIEFDGSCTLHQHITKMINTTTELRSMELEASENSLCSLSLTPYLLNIVHSK